MTYRRTTTAPQMNATNALHGFVRDATIDLTRHDAIDQAVNFAPRVRMAQKAVDACNLSGDVEEAVNALVAAAVEAALATGWHLARNPECLLFESDRKPHGLLEV